MQIEIAGVRGEYRIEQGHVRDIGAAQMYGQGARVAAGMRLPAYARTMARHAAHLAMEALPELRA